MRLRRWKVDRWLDVGYGATLPMTPVFFFTRRGAASYRRFGGTWGLNISTAEPCKVGRS